MSQSLIRHKSLRNDFEKMEQIWEQITLWMIEGHIFIFVQINENECLRKYYKKTGKPVNFLAKILQQNSKNSMKIIRKPLMFRALLENQSGHDWSRNSVEVSETFSPQNFL